jgi:hypothetical protein
MFLYELAQMRGGLTEQMMIFSQLFVHPLPPKGGSERSHPVIIAMRNIIYFITNLSPDKTHRNNVL